MSDTDRLVEELQAIKFILTLGNSVAIDTYMNKIIASTPRRRMWTLIDGVKTQTDISKEVGISQPAVSIFLTSVQRAGLVKYNSKNPPRKIIDYIPPEWLKEIEEAEAKQKPKEQVTKEPSLNPN